MKVPGVAVKPVRDKTPVPVTVRLGPTPLKLKLSVVTDKAVVRAPSIAEYIVNGVAVPVLKLVIVTQPVQFASTVKLPLSPPMLAGLTNVIDVAV
jgi:hypothetical protein